MFVTLCAIPCSWLAVKKEQAKREREAVAAIRQLGGGVLYDDRFFHNVQSVFLFMGDVTDTDVENLKGLTQLKELGLNYTSVTDNGLEHLKGLKQLQQLDLRGTTKVTDVGVEKLQQALPNCKIYR